MRSTTTHRTQCIIPKNNKHNNTHVPGSHSDQRYITHCPWLAKVTEMQTTRCNIARKETLHCKIARTKTQCNHCANMPTLVGISTQCNHNLEPQCQRRQHSEVRLTRHADKAQTWKHGKHSARMRNTCRSEHAEKHDRATNTNVQKHKERAQPTKNARREKIKTTQSQMHDSKSNHAKNNHT